MATEIERKFLVKDDSWKESATGAGTLFRQGYMLTDPGKTIRVRIAGDKGYITIKGKTEGVSRAEYEYLIPLPDAAAMLEQFCSGIITKRRYLVQFKQKTWEVDVFEEDNAGLVLAELELQSEEEAFVLPPWAGKEVSDDHRYFNSWLSEHPYPEWKE